MWKRTAIPVASPLIALLALASTGGCDLLTGEPAADVANPKRYQGHELAFDYPGNWSQTEETEVMEGIEMVTISAESPGSSLAIVQQFRPSVPVGLDDVLDDFTASMRESLSEEMGGVVDMSERDQSTVEHALLGATREGRRKRYSLTMLGESAAHTVDMYAAEFDDRALIVYVQAADEDLEKATPGFELVMGSLVTQ